MIFGKDTECIIPSKQKYRYGEREKKLAVFQCDDKRMKVLHDAAKEDLEQHAATVASCFRAVVRKGGYTDDEEEHFERRKYAPSAFIRSLELAKETKAGRKTIISELGKVLDAGKGGRSIGHVVYAVPEQMDTWCVDWTLVELNPKYHDCSLVGFLDHH